MRFNGKNYREIICEYRYPFISRGKIVEINPGCNTDTRRMAALPSLYRLTDLYGSKGGCLCTAGNHPAILIDFNHEQIS